MHAYCVLYFVRHEHDSPELIRPIPISAKTFFFQKKTLQIMSHAVERCKTFNASLFQCWLSISLPVLSKRCSALDAVNAIECYFTIRENQNIISFSTFPSCRFVSEIFFVESFCAEHECVLCPTFLLLDAR